MLRLSPVVRFKKIFVKKKTPASTFTFNKEKRVQYATKKKKTQNVLMYLGIFFYPATYSNTNSFLVAHSLQRFKKKNSNKMLNLEKD